MNDAWKLQRAAISGTVRDAEGRPLADAQVCALTSSPLLATSDTFKPACAATQRDGHYRIEGLWAVGHTVSASAPGHVPAFYVRGDRPVSFDQIDLKPGGEAHEIDITLHGGAVQIHGTVKDLSGGPVEAAVVTSGGVYYGTGMAVTSSGPEGEFSLWVRPGTPAVWARAEGYAGGTDSGAAPGHAFELFLTPEAVLIGKVVRAGDGAPVEGARVTAQRGDAFGGSGGGAITDARGNFRLAQLTPGAYKASVEADDAYGMAAEQVVLGLGETSTPIVIEAHPAALVEGKIVIAGGVACPSGSVHLDPERGRNNGAEVEADGLVRLRGVLPGTYAVTVRCDGFIPAEQYPPVVVADRPITGLRWQVSPGQAIRGLVVSARGEPVAGVRVFAGFKPGSAPPGARIHNAASIATDMRGRFELPGLVPGDYELRALVMTGGRATPDKPSAVTLPAGEDLEGVRIAMQTAGEVRGEVRDSHGEPVTRAKVTLQAPGRRAFTAMTGADGAFHVLEATVGEYRASASREGVPLRAPGTGDDDLQGVKVAVRADAVTTVKLVVETTRGQIDGVVREAGGVPVSDAFVEVDRESESAVGPGGPSPRWFSFNQRPRLTDAEGRFSLEGLSPGKYTIRALRRGGGEAKLEHVALGADVTLTIAETARLAGTVALESGGVPAEFTVLLEDPTTGFRRSDQFFRTGGAWRFTELPPGSYKLELSAPEGAHSTELSLGAGEEKTGLRLELDAKVKVRGTVLDLEGAPVADVEVHLAEAGVFNYDSRPRPRTDAAGRFELAGVALGDVMLLLSPRGGPVEHSRTTISTRVSGGPEVELPPIHLATLRVKPGEVSGDLGYALKHAAPGAAAAERSLEVALVRPGGPAAAAGLQVGDRIVSVDGEDVTGERHHLYAAMTRVAVGVPLRLGLARGATVELTSATPP